MPGGMDLDAAAAIAADPDAPARARVDALVEVVETCSRRRVPPPTALVDAIDDLALVDAAIAWRKAGAVCAALIQLGPRPDLATTRKRIVRRLVAARVTGLPLAGLAISIGDEAAGVLLATRELAEHIVPLVPRMPPHPLVGAALAWLAAQPPGATAAILGGLRVSLEELLAHAANPGDAEALRRAARGILER
jgi:hypothetical protein